MKTLLKVALWGISLFVITMVALFAFLMWCAHIPSDEQIQKRFVRDKLALTELVHKLSSEPPRIIGITQDEVMLDDTINWVSPDKAGVSIGQFAQYQTLLNQAHVTQVWRDQNTINVNVAAYGFASSGWRLAFTYTTKVPSPVVPTIDSPPTASQEGAVIYRPLGDDWYIRLIY